MREPPSHVPLSVLFTDIEGSTRLRTERGDEIADALTRLHEEIISDHAGRHGGRVIKSLGDGFIVAFESVRSALTCAAGIQRTHDRHSRENPDRTIRVRIGLNTGEVAERDGDLYGEAVNAAARIVALADGGEILVSRVVKDLAGTVPGLAFGDRGAVPLKGFPEPWHLYEVAWQERDEEPVLHLRLLGDLDIRYGRERTSPVESARLRSLLAYLLLRRDRPQARQHLAFVLWPDSSEAQARTNLRQLLHHLRRAIPDAERFLAIGTRTIGWRPDAPYTLDVAEFEEAAARAEADPDDSREALEAAAERYSGDLLPSCYDEWILPERERLRGQAISILERLTEILERERDYRAGIRHAERLLAHDPLHEATYRRLMRLHALSGERARALRVYHACVTVLERELGVEPSPATREAYAAIMSAGTTPLGTPRTALATQAPFVGRREEWDQLLRIWHEAASGAARCALINGEAGIGKSRLVEEIRTWCARQGIPTAATRAYEAEGALAYSPIAEWLRSETLRPGLARLEEVWLAEVARLLPELHSEHPDLPRPEPLSEAEQRQRLFEALARAVLAPGGPLLLVLDDLQWCDRETLNVLHYLLRFDPRAPLLVVATARGDEIDPEHPATTLLAGLQGIGCLAEIPLRPLDPEESAELAGRLIEGPLDGSLAERLHRDSEGNPLFLVETLRAGLDTSRTPAGAASGAPGTRPAAAPAGTARLPPKVQAVIETRLGHLSLPARELVTLAATVGREFTFEVVSHAHEGDENELVTALDELWQRRIIRERGTAGYDFSHDKIREVAYAGIGPALRRRLHLSVARALEACHADNLDPVSAQIATHYDRAGSLERALAAYRQAAEVAARVFATQEIIDLLGRARELIPQIPASPERDEQELAVLLQLGPAYVALIGYGSAEALEVYSGARAVCERLGRALEPPVLRGVALAAIVRRDFDESFAIAAELLERSEREGDERLAVEGHYVHGVSAFWIGAFTQSQHHLEEAIARYRPEQYREHIALFAQDPKAVCLIRLAWTLWSLGFPDQAARVRDEALMLAERLGHPFTRGYVLTFAARVTEDLRDHPRGAEWSKALARTPPNPYLEAEAITLEGWAWAQNGNLSDAEARVREGLARMRDGGSVLTEAPTLLFLAQILARSGDLKAGLAALEEALGIAVASTRYVEAEIHRLRGEMLARAGSDPAGVEDAFARALEVSRSQQARAFELRAATSLVRWRGASGRPIEDAVEHLKGVYGWFTEGHETPDLREAAAALDELS